MIINILKERKENGIWSFETQWQEELQGCYKTQPEGTEIVLEEYEEDGEIFRLTQQW